MTTGSKCPSFLGQNTLIVIIITGILFGIFLFWLDWSPRAQTHLAELSLEQNFGELALIGENSLLPLVEPANPEALAVREIPVVITGYSSSPWETDGSPFITAAGTWVKEGIIANNMLPFGTKVKIPELYGDKIFVVEDRMHWRKSAYQIDIWFPSYWEALNFGVKRTFIEILEG